MVYVPVALHDPTVAHAKKTSLFHLLYFMSDERRDLALQSRSRVCFDRNVCCVLGAAVERRCHF
jgi:hypothetical protein